MARIRTIKPEFWTSEQVMDCSTNARLLFIGLWNFCDDEGRMAASAKRIKACIFPSDDFVSEDVRGMIQELSENGLILLYVVAGIEYLQVTGWHHQRIDKPQSSKLPPMPPPHSPNDPGSFHVGKEGKGRERKGRDSTSGGGSDSHPARPTLNEAEQQPIKAREPAPPLPPTWNSRENFDRVERRCREVLPAGWVQDLVVGPMARLEGEQGLDLEREIVPALLDLAASRRVPIRTWGVLANAVAERVIAQRQTRAAQGLPATPAAPTPEGEKVSLGVSGMWSEGVIREAVALHRSRPGSWSEAIFGPPPGQPGCRVPPRFLIEAA